MAISFNKRLSAFSLIELMIMFIIIGILASIAVPAYHNYVVRASVAKALPLAESMKNEVLQYFQDNNALPCCGSTTNILLGQNGYSGPLTVYYNGLTSDMYQISYTGYTNNMAHIDLWFTQTFSKKNFNINSYIRFTLQAQVDSNGQLTWICGPYYDPTYSVPAAYLPQTCQGVTTNS